MPGTIIRNITGPFITVPFQTPPGHSLALSLAGTTFSAVLECTLDADSPDWVQLGPTFTTSVLYNAPVGPVKYRFNIASGTVLSAQYSSSLVQSQNIYNSFIGPDYSASITTAQSTANSAQGAANVALSAVSYASKAALSADSLLPNTIRAFTGDSMWDWSATGTIDGGRTIAGANGGYRTRSDLGGARPEWYGAVGNGVADDTGPVSACINNNALTLLRYGATYRIRQPLFAYNLCRIIAEGVILRQLNGYPDDIAVSRPRAARIFWDPITVPTFETACLTLQRSGSEFSGEIYTNQPNDTLGWTPIETGWAINVYAPWCEISGMARGFRYGIRGGKAATFECAGIRIPVWYDGCYDVGIKIEQCTDTPRIGHVHGSIWAEPNNFSDANRIKYRLLNHQCVWLKRADGAVIGEIFSFLGNTALFLEGVSAKTTVNVLDGDDSLYAVRISGGGDLNIGTLIYQRCPEGGYATGSNPAGLVTGLDAGNAITTYAGASGMITVANADIRNTRGGMVYLDGSAKVKIAQGQVVNWGVKAGNTEACFSVAGAGCSLTLGEGVEVGPSSSAAQVFAVNAPAILHATALGSQTPGSPTIAAGATVDFGILAPGCQPGMTVSVGASGFVNDGITAQGIVSSAGTVTVRLRNSTAAPIILTALTWRVVCKS